MCTFNQLFVPSFNIFLQTFITFSRVFSLLKCHPVFENVRNEQILAQFTTLIIYFCLRHFYKNVLQNSIWLSNWTTLHRCVVLRNKCLRKSGYAFSSHTHTLEFIMYNVLWENRRVSPQAKTCRHEYHHSSLVCLLLEVNLCRFGFTKLKSFICHHLFSLW